MSYTDKTRLLKLYMNNLPYELPYAATGSRINKLLDFSLDPAWVSEIGEAMTVNREIEAAMFDFGARNDEGIFNITSRGPGIESLADILQEWLEKYPDALILKKWVDDATASAKAIILAYNEPLPSLPEVPPEAPPAAAVPPKQNKKAKAVGKQTTLTGGTVKEKKKKKKDDVPPCGDKPDTKCLADTSDPDLGTASESEDERTGGRKLDPLLLKISKPYYRKSDGKKAVRCLASAGCKTTWSWPRAKGRILKHAMGCAHLATFDGGTLVEASIAALAQKNPSLLENLNTKFGIQPKRSHDVMESESSPPTEAPPLKRSKTMASTSSGVSTPARAESDLRGSTQNHVTKYRTEGRKALEKKVNDALVEFFVCCGVAPRIIGREEFKHLVNTLSQGNYNPVSRTTFEDALVPAYAANVRIAMKEYLCTCFFLTISFDGGNLARKKFISITITTPHRQSFCVDLDDVSRVSQTGEYMAELLEKWILQIGPSRFCAVASDNASPPRKDACHNLHNACKDICNIPVFQPIIADLRELLAFMSLSSYSKDWFDLARKDFGISRGLQSVGETRFGTIYWSLDSVLRGIPAFVSIVRNPSLGINSEVLRQHFLDDDDVFKFRRDLTRLGAVLMPFARAIQCLESKDTTPADVYLYWLAVVAQLHDLITKDDNAGIKSKYTTRVKELIRGIANYRFSQLIEDERASNVYLTAFVLDPDNRGASILATPNPLAIQPVTISIRGGESSVKPHPPLAQRIGLSLQKILQREYGDEFRPGRTIEEAKKAMFEINPYIANRTPTDALAALRTQLKNFLDGTTPFDRKKKPTESSREWWWVLLNREDSDILAALAVKIFSSSPVSMPDERGMSTITWVNSDVRNKQDVPTVSNHMAIRSFSRMDSQSEVRRKPLTVNWRDIQATIHGKPSVATNGAPRTERVESDQDSATSPLQHPDPVDGLSWLDDGLPDLRTSSNTQFDLAAEFDIKKYLHILADSILMPEEADGETRKEPARQPTGLGAKAAAESAAPKDDDWGSWE
ncbi:ribonuclease H-like domain-containing protein [Mycena galericulata]|nr:ribonuclease H-like domain-containing protein [Mycena galericulata]